MARKVSKMDVNIFSRIIILATIIHLTLSSCEIDNHVGNCRYEIRCETLVGSVSNPGCDTEPYVTFIITNSDQNYLTPGYFAATNFDSRVREIKAVNNSWNKIDSFAFRYYAKCLRMDLSYNNIAKINSEGFRNLGFMRFLNLSGNVIESFYPKSFLISDSRTTDLKVLDLSYNRLQYLGSELNEVSFLNKLYLQNNRLSTLADDAFMNLKDLSHLYLQNNLLSSVNLSLIHLKSLVTLDISDNHLFKLSGYEINRLAALVNFNISHNELTFVESNCFNQAINLQTADFSFNNINMTIESGMFLNNNKLDYLNFCNNKIVGLQDNAFQHCNLNYLNLENNNIYGDLKPETLENLRNITKLDLSQQNVTGIRNNAFADMETLVHLNLSKNSIAIVEQSSFENTSITVLDLSHNKVPNLNYVKNCLVDLNELYLNNNNITAIPKYTFDKQTQLRILDLSKNHIISIEEYSLPLINLQYLNIAGNRINGAVKQNVFSPAKYLRLLDLSYFNISKIDNLAFVNLPVLAKLNLSNNDINSIEVDSFKGVDNLYSLDMSYNKITEFKLNSSKLINLKALHLSHNKIANVTGLFTSLCKLTYLDLSHNYIQNISEIGSNIFPNLTVLYLDDNKITDFNNPKTNSLTTLIDLRLSSNNISDIKLSYFKDLMSVDLSNNGLAYLNSTFLEKNDFLQALDVSRNKITDLPPGTFRFMKNLKFLNLSSNFLTKLRYGSLKGLHKTELLDLSKNMIEQLDVDIFHECDELKTLIIDYNRIKTFDFERLILNVVRKLRTLSLGGNPILCKEIVHNIKSTNTTIYAIRQVEVTSIHEIYHEDNVHGIKCGDDPPMSSTTIKPNSSELDSPKKVIVHAHTSTVVVLIWCSVLTIVFIAAFVVAYMKLYKKRVFVVNRNMTMQLRNSIDSNGTDFQSDLLG